MDDNVFFATVIYVFFLLCSIPEYVWRPVLPLFFPAASGQGQIQVLSDMKIKNKKIPHMCFGKSAFTAEFHLWLS